MWIVLRLVNEYKLKLFKICAVSIVVISGTFYIVDLNFHSGKYIHELPHLSFMFFLGSLYYLYKDKIVLHKYVFVILGMMLLISTFNKSIFSIIYNVSISYLVFCVAYLPTGKIVWSYNKLGDYSYGLYIYAYPVQQTIVFFAPAISPLGLVIPATIVTGALAILSWHALERRALRFRF